MCIGYIDDVLIYLFIETYNYYNILNNTRMVCVKFSFFQLNKVIICRYPQKYPQQYILFGEYTTVADTISQTLSILPFKKIIYEHSKLN